VRRIRPAGSPDILRPTSSLIPRRAFLAGAGASLVAARAWAQQRRVPRVALVNASRPITDMTLTGFPNFIAFLKELERLGWVEGQSIAFERWTTGGRTDLFGKLAEDVVASSPNVIFLSTGQALGHIFGPLTKTIPIVQYAGDPVAQGLAAGLPRPGGNVTGFMSSTGPENEGKRLELLCKAVPAALRIGYLAPPYFFDTVFGVYIRQAAPQLGVTLVPLMLDAKVSEASYRTVFASLVPEKIDALLIPGASENTANLRLLVELTAAARIPSIYNMREYPDQGGMMSYGPSQTALFKNCAQYVARILMGEKPGDLPIQLPGDFEFVVNLKTARAFGLDIPYTVTAFANEIIE
jgi:putative tryptophan/tyrosine transport system substrate-binding protein